MNIFNKIVVVILLIFLIGISIFGILNTFIKWVSWSDAASKIFNSDIAFRNQYIAVLVLPFVIILCLFLLVLEFYRKKSRVAVVASVRGGKAFITLDSIAGQLKDNLSKISGTKDLYVKALPKSKGIVINIFSKICEDCNVPNKMQEIIKAASDFAASKLGLKVLRTNLTIINLTNIDYDTKGKTIRTENSLQVDEPAESEKTIRPNEDIKEDASNNVPAERNLITIENNKDIPNSAKEKEITDN
ncbi:MAG TPA: hypothetical protein GXZ93_02170 [Actinobacteria bacterium]|jgi:hypothetical protein|nr:hypothetical protein [Actinomycetota bacterium]